MHSRDQPSPGSEGKNARERTQSLAEGTSGDKGRLVLGKEHSCAVPVNGLFGAARETTDQRVGEVTSRGWAWGRESVGKSESGISKERIKWRIEHVRVPRDRRSGGSGDDCKTVQVRW